MSLYSLNIVSMPYTYLPTRNQFKKNGVRKAKSWLQYRKDSLRAEIGALEQELTILKQEKTELENLLKTQKEANKLQAQEMQIEIDLNKLVHQIAKITQTNYFQQLQAEVKYLRNTDY